MTAEMTEKANHKKRKKTQALTLKKQPLNKKITKISKKKKTVSKQKAQRNHSRKKTTKLTLVSELIILILMVIFCAFMFARYTSHRVAGVSMEPTLANGDRIIIRQTKEPKRNDIITLFPDTGSKENYVKRVIGMPEDRFYLQDDRLFLFPAGADYGENDNLSDSSKLPDSTTVFFLTKEVAKELKGMDRIPKDAYFVVGDNRRDSLDSRSFSFIKKEQIEGVLTLRIFPFSQLGIVH